MLTVTSKYLVCVEKFHGTESCLFFSSEKIELKNMMYIKGNVKPDRYVESCSWQDPAFTDINGPSARCQYLTFGLSLFSSNTLLPCCLKWMLAFDTTGTGHAACRHQAVALSCKQKGCCSSRGRQCLYGAEKTS